MGNQIGRRLRAWMSISTLATAALLLGAGTTGSCFDFSVEVLSSPPEQVSGGDARIAIGVPQIVPPHQVRVSVDGVDVTDAFELIPGTRTLEGVVTGLVEGDNLLEVHSNGNGNGRPSAELVLTNHAISGPIFSGPQQVPFYCSDDGDRANAELGPAIDADCAVETVVSFKYMTTGGGWADYDPAAPRPSDMSETTTMDGDTVDFIVRWERGTINRFIYSLAVLSPGAQDEATPDLSAWNRRLIYYFQGGVAIGRYQGDPSRSRMLYEHGLSLGYAVAYSTGTKTGTHYNLELGGETAIMVKDRFVSAYASPDYTVGVGGSGGGIQQYVYGQNHKTLLDAGVPQYSYPDMIGQTIHIGDCELLERWIDTQVFAGNLKWADWENRTEIEGLNALNGFDNDFLPLLPPGFPQGSSECVNGWRGLSPLALNPHFGTVPGISLPDQISTEWTHYADAVNVYGVAADGFAASTWDNVGVQYGLDALVSGFLDADEFLDLNANVGSWKNEPDMVQEGCPFIFSDCFMDLTGLPPFPDIWPNIIDPWSWRNMALSADGGSDRARLRARPRQSRRHPDSVDRLAQLPRRRSRHAQLPPVLRGPPAPAQLRRRRVEPGDLVHGPRAVRPDADGVRGDRRVDAQHRGQSAQERGREQADRRSGQLLRSRRHADLRGGRRLGGDPRRRARRSVHKRDAALLDLTHHRGRTHHG
jgi:hypothetical protein